MSFTKWFTLFLRNAFVQKRFGFRLIDALFYHTYSGLWTVVFCSQVYCSRIA